MPQTTPLGSAEQVFFGALFMIAKRKTHKLHGSSDFEPSLHALSVIGHYRILGFCVLVQGNAQYSRYKLFRQEEGHILVTHHCSSNLPSMLVLTEALGRRVPWCRVSFQHGSENWIAPFMGEE